MIRSVESHPPNPNHIPSQSLNQPIMDPTTPFTQIETGEISHMQRSVLERKRDNIQFIYSCYEQHHAYYHQHINLLSAVESSIQTNIKETRQCCLQTYQYFEMIRNSYWALLRGLTKKSSAFPYFGEENGKEWYEHIIDGMKGVKSVNGEIGVSISTFLQWEEGTFLPQLRRAMEFYVQPLKILWDKLGQRKQQLKGSLRVVQKRFERIKKNAQEMMKKLEYQGDLLIEELEFVELCKYFREDVREWGREVHRYWKTIQESESTLFNSLKRDISTFYIEIQKVHRGAERHKEVQEYWDQVGVEREVAKGYAIDRLLSEELLGFLSLHSQGVDGLEQKFIRFINIQKQDEIIDRSKDLIDFLSLKGFSCRISSNRAEVYIHSSADGNLVFLMRETLQPLYRMVLRLVSSRRVNQYSIQLNEIVPGIFVDSIKKEILHFTTQDSLEQFVHYINNIPHS